MAPDPRPDVDVVTDDDGADDANKDDANEDDADNVRRPADPLSRLPHRFLAVLSVMCCGRDGLRLEMVYHSRSNTRCTVLVKGPWQDVVRGCVAEARRFPATKATPSAVEVDLSGTDAWPHVLVKLQRARDYDADEDACHARVTEVCPSVGPRFIMGLTLGTCRVAFMEYLEGCTPVRDSTDRGIAAACLSKVTDMWLRAGVLHCDLHDSNVLVRADGEPFVIDFGMAIRMSEVMRGRLEAAIARGASPADAYDRLCRRHAHKTLQKRGYDIGDDDWNNDGAFVRRMQQQQQQQQQRGPVRNKVDRMSSSGSD